MFDFDRLPVDKCPQPRNTLSSLIRRILVDSIGEADQTPIMNDAYLVEVSTLTLIQCSALSAPFVDRCPGHHSSHQKEALRRDRGVRRWLSRARKKAREPAPGAPAVVGQSRPAAYKKERTARARIGCVLRRSPFFSVSWMRRKGNRPIAVKRGPATSSNQGALRKT